MVKESRMFETKSIETYIHYLEGQERADHTIRKYRHDLMALQRWLAGRNLSKEELIEWKKSLTASHSVVSVNSMLAAVNGFLRFMEWQDFMVRPLKVQKSLFRDENRELTKEEYIRLVKTARNNQKERLALILQTICMGGLTRSGRSLTITNRSGGGRWRESKSGRPRF